MIHLGMVAGTPSAPTPTARVYSSSGWLRAPVGQGGVFYADKLLGAVITAGDPRPYR